MKSCKCVQNKYKFLKKGRKKKEDLRQKSNAYSNADW